MVDPSIEFRSIIMRCDSINHSAYSPLPDNVTIEYYREGMEMIWQDIQKAAGEFSAKSDLEILDYFSQRFGRKKELLQTRCLFLKDQATEHYIGTCMAWEAQKGEQTIPILHWLAVSDEFAGHGFARILISLIMQIFEEAYPGQSIYLHTQPSSYPAIKLYHDFGFQLCRTDTYGTAINEYGAAIQVLKKIMHQPEYTSLLSDSVE